VRRYKKAIRWEGLHYDADTRVVRFFTADFTPEMLKSIGESYIEYFDYATRDVIGWHALVKKCPEYNFKVIERGYCEYCRKMFELTDEGKLPEHLFFGTLGQCVGSGTDEVDKI